MLPAMLMFLIVFLRSFSGLIRSYDLNNTKLVSIFLEIVIIGWIGGIIGSKIDFFFQSNIQLKSDIDLKALLKFSLDGQRWYTAFLFGLVYINFFVRPKLSVKDYLIFLDRVSIVLCFFFIFGKVACFLSGHVGGCGGSHTSLPWGVLMPYGLKPSHPRQLYDAIFHLLLFVALYLIYSKKPNKLGLISSVFLIVSPAYSFLSEFLSINDVIFCGLRAAQFGYLAILFIAIYHLQIYKRYSSHSTVIS